MKLGLLITLPIVILVLMHITIEWSVHRDQVKVFTETWAKGSYKDFIREFKKYDWERESKWSMGYFCHPCNSKIHANIIEFNGKGMILDPISYLLFMVFLFRNRLKNDSKQVERW